MLHRAAAENLSCLELASIYNIGNPHSITTWQRQYAEGVLGSLVNMHPLGQDVSMSKNKKTSTRSSDAKQSDDPDCLLRENERLRAEVAYLKKFNALVLATKLAQQKKPK